MASRVALRYLRGALHRGWFATIHQPATAPILAVVLPLGLGLLYAAANLSFAPSYLPPMPFAILAVSLAAWRGRLIGCVAGVIGVCAWILTATYPKDLVLVELQTANGIPVILDVLTLLLGAYLVGWARERQQARLAYEEHLRHQLLEARGSREAFMATAAHELRTPLTVQRMVVQTQIARLRKQAGQTSSDDETTALLRRIGELELTDAAVDRMIRVVNAMLTDAQITNGREVVHIENCDLCAVAEGAVLRMRHLWPARLIQARLPQAPVWVRADPDRLFQVFDHLLHNAVKYSVETSEIIVALYLCEYQGVPMAEAIVVDQGVGIPLAEQERIWTRFGQAGGINKAPGASSHLGLGLGLYLVRTLIAQQDGSVGVRSAPGTGSSFWFRLPLAEEPRAEGPDYLTSS